MTVVRNEAKHLPLMVCSLCRDTSEKYAEAYRNLSLANKESDLKFLAFLDFKAQFFLAKAYYYQALDLMNPSDPAVGRAIRSFDSAVQNMDTSITIFLRFMSLAPKSKGVEAFGKISLSFIFFFFSSLNPFSFSFSSLFSFLSSTQNSLRTLATRTRASSRRSRVRTTACTTSASQSR